MTPGEMHGTMRHRPTGARLWRALGRNLPYLVAILAGPIVGLIARGIDHYAYDTCKRCHFTSREAPATPTGFAKHRTYADLQCNGCHAEHHQEGEGNNSLGRPLCKQCHCRHVGKQFPYALAPAAHPEKTVHPEHREWATNCSACHVREGGLSAKKCRACHDPGEPLRALLRGFRRHQTCSTLNCLDCHLDHQPTRRLLRPGKSIQKVGCKICHQRHVGPARQYTLPTDKHPDAKLHASHQRWEDNCFACHQRGTGRHQCVSCHDPATDQPVKFTGFTKHHTRRDLKCLNCHTEHRGTMRPGITFQSMECKTCHARDLAKPRDISNLPQAVRGPSTTFSHAKHASDRLACAECHPMKLGKAHLLVKPYDRVCSDCHHGSKQAASCAHCHQRTAQYFVGRFDGELVGKGTHARSDTVRCQSCHRYDATTKRFAPTESTCEECHPKSYTPVFLKARRDWRQWQTSLAGRLADNAQTEALHFVARNWYHNDKHAARVRKGFKAQR